MIIDKIIDYIRDCPLLDANTPITSDYLSEEALNYSIETSPTETVTTEYIDGSTERQLVFYLTSREVASAYDDINIQNTIFYENFANWIEEQNDLGNLPELDNPCVALSIETLSPAYVVQIDADRARYVIHMKFTYFKGGKI